MQRSILICSLSLFPVSFVFFNAESLLLILHQSPCVAKCVHMCVHVCFMHACMCVCVCACVLMHTCTCTCKCVYVMLACVCMCVCVCSCVRVRACVSVCVCSCERMQPIQEVSLVMHHRELDLIGLANGSIVIGMIRVPTSWPPILNVLHT